MTEAATNAKSWPFQEARSLLEHITRKGKKPGDLVTFETGYGPSGAPHIGTFGEVVRTLMVKTAFEELTDNAYPTRLIVFSDDYDGFRRRPDGLPIEMEEDIGLPLSSVRDPSGQYPSFAHANNAALRAFIDGMLLELDLKREDEDSSEFYTFQSATECYRTGVFNDVLLRVWQNYDAILGIMVPTLGSERASTYSPFMPQSYPVAGKAAAILQVPVKRITEDQWTFNQEFEPSWIEFSQGDVTFRNPILNGAAKLQWKVDWAARWVAFDVDYEMCGKDLIDSYKASSKICRVLGGVPPANLTYELFLDEEGHKISKSKGNGFTIAAWQRYSHYRALAMFMYQSPRAAKELSHRVIPRVTDEYYKHLSEWATQSPAQQLDNPIWHISGGCQPEFFNSTANYSLLSNIASASGISNPEVFINYLKTYRPEDFDGGNSERRLRQLAMYVLRYTLIYILPEKEDKKRLPTDIERIAFLDLATRIEVLGEGRDSEEYQFEVYEVGKAHNFDPLRLWFQAIYEVFFGSSQGPRFGTFVASYGANNTAQLLRSINQ